MKYCKWLIIIVGWITKLLPHDVVPAIAAPASGCPIVPVSANVPPADCPPPQSMVYEVIANWAWAGAAERAKASAAGASADVRPRIAAGPAALDDPQRAAGVGAARLCCCARCALRALVVEHCAHLVTEGCRGGG